MSFNVFTIKFAWVALLTATVTGLCSCSSTRSATLAGSANTSLAVVNRTGSGLTAVYLSRSDAADWQENVLGTGELAAGGLLNITFTSGERGALWDMRIEAGDGYYAEWKSIDLSNARRIELILKLAPKTAVVAEVEQNTPGS